VTVFLGKYMEQIDILHQLNVRSKLSLSSVSKIKYEIFLHKLSQYQARSICTFYIIIYTVVQRP
jgi:hypothetical protein